MQDKDYFFVSIVLLIITFCISFTLLTGHLYTIEETDKDGNKMKDIPLYLVSLNNEKTAFDSATTDTLFGLIISFIIFMFLSIVFSCGCYSERSTQVPFIICIIISFAIITSILSISLDTKVNGTNKNIQQLLMENSNSNTISMISTMVVPMFLLFVILCFEFSDIKKYVADAGSKRYDELRRFMLENQKYIRHKSGQKSKRRFGIY